MRHVSVACALGSGQGFRVLAATRFEARATLWPMLEVVGRRPVPPKKRLCTNNTIAASATRLLRRERSRFRLLAGQACLQIRRLWQLHSPRPRAAGDKQKHRAEHSNAVVCLGLSRRALQRPVRSARTIASSWPCWQIVTILCLAIVAPIAQGPYRIVHAKVRRSAYRQRNISLCVPHDPPRDNRTLQCTASQHDPVRWEHAQPLHVLPCADNFAGMRAYATGWRGFRLCAQPLHAQSPALSGSTPGAAALSHAITSARSGPQGAAKACARFATALGGAAHAFLPWPYFCCICV